MNQIIKIDNRLDCDIYVSSFNNKERENKIINYLNTVSLSATIYSNQSNDPRVDLIVSKINKDLSRTYGAFFSILKMIEDFYYYSDKTYGLFLENDVQFKKTIRLDLPKVLDDIKRLNLDVLLIGYLLNCSPEQYGCTKINHRYYDYPDNLWGSHAFILTKPQALYFIQKYTVDY